MLNRLKGCRRKKNLNAMKTKFILVSLLALLVFSACNTEERRKAESARIEAAAEAESARIAAAAEAEAARIAAAAEAEAARIAAAVEAEAKAAHQRMLAEYEELMVDHCYEGVMFDLPNEKGEGVGVFRYGFGYYIFLYKIKDDGKLAIDYGKKSGWFQTWERIQEDYRGKLDEIAEKYDVAIEGKYYVFNSLDEIPKAEVRFVWDGRELQYYNRETGDTSYKKKQYDEELYQEAMEVIRHCLPKAKEIMKR